MIWVSGLAAMASAWATESVFFVGGQSNAKAALALGVQEVFERSPQLGAFRIVARMHSGAALSSWHGEEPTTNYHVDFFGPSGSPGMLEQGLTDGAGRFSALFWFQGESDRLPSEAAQYGDRFLAMLDSLAADLGFDEGFTTSGVRVHLAQVSLMDGEADAIRSVQANVVASNPDQISLIDTASYYRPDGTHMMDCDLYDLGRRLANQYLEAEGLPTVDYVHDWIGGSSGPWGSPASWSGNAVPEQSEFPQIARIGGEWEGIGDLWVDGAYYVNQLRVGPMWGAWRLVGGGSLSLTDGVDVRNSSLELSIPLNGGLIFRGGGSLVDIHAPLSGWELRMGCEFAPASVYRFAGEGVLGSSLKYIYLGQSKGGSSVTPWFEATEDQSVIGNVTVSGAAREGMPRADLLVRNDAVWVQETSSSMQLGRSNSNGNWASAGSLRIGSDGGSRGSVCFKPYSRFKAGCNAGAGEVEVANGLLRIEGAADDLVTLGDAVRADDAGKEGSGCIRLEGGGVLETARPFKATKLVSDGGVVNRGDATFVFSGGLLRVLQSEPSREGPLDLFSIEGVSTAGVEVVFDDEGAFVDTNGMDALIQSAVSGEGGLVKRGEGELSFGGEVLYRGNTSVEQGDLRFEREVVVSAGSTMTIRDGRLIAPRLYNYGTLRLVGDGRLEVAGVVMNFGLLDRLESTAPAPAELVNLGERVDIEDFRIEEVLREGDRFVIRFPAFRGHRFQLQRALAGASEWEAVEGVLEGDGNLAEFTVDAVNASAIYRVATLP